MVRPTSQRRFALSRLPSPIGVMLVVVDDQDQLRALDWEDYEGRLHKLLGRHYGPQGAHPVEQPAPASIRQPLEAYFEGELAAIEAISVQTEGTTFQRDVWAALRTIPAGSTLSYGGLARQIGRPSAVRAVGLANGANPTGLVVPCHRVIGANGKLTGYGGGMERKRWLLAHEGLDVAA
jgi:methylated-DNA-[protein]-cysteine S-methyltransferase